MKKLFFLIAASFFLTSVDAQITERERPAEWQHCTFYGPFPSYAGRHSD